MKIKLLSNTSIMKDFKESTLPFEHYYVYGSVVRDARYKWILEAWENLRRIAKEKDL